MIIALLGATGSIGRQALDVVRTTLPHAKIEILTGHRNTKLLVELAAEFSPEYIWVPDATAAGELRHCNAKVLTGESELLSYIKSCNANVVVNAMVGGAGLRPTLAAIEAGKDIALANKESLVTAGQLIMPLAKKMGVRITPIDSEHSAIWQCLQGNDIAAVEKIILTASGGPFRTWEKEKIAAATAEDALRHPNWNMGPKITIDSATFMNKGLELIEAMWLFDQPLSNIEIVVHPQSLIHSMVQYIDGSIIAQIGTPDMRMPILYALSAPDRVKTNFPRLDLLTAGSGNMTFEAPCEIRFPCLALAKHAAIVGGTLPAVMNAVNEWAVGQFLNKKINFYDISELIIQAFGAYHVKPLTCAADIAEAEAWAADYIKSKG